jgi:hypothetical protein
VGRRFTSPSYLPLDSARHAACTAWFLLKTYFENSNRLRSASSISNHLLVKTPSSARNGPPEQRTARLFLVLFLACFLAAALASQRFFDSLSLARLQVKGVTFYFLDNVLSLHLPLESSQRVFEGLTLLKSNFRQKTTPPTRPNWTR